MITQTKDIARISAIAVLLSFAACATEIGQTTAEHPPSANAENAPPAAAFASKPSPSPAFPDLQAELLDDRGKTTASPLGKFDFKNFIFPLPRGWQHPDGDEIVLIDGKLEPKFRDIAEEMTDEEKSAARSERRIGMAYVTTKYIDATGDGLDEAVVILKVQTGGAAIPQLVYLYEWRDDAPNLLWNFRTGDRADGGLKDIRVENGDVIVELYGQDRFILGQTETGKITGDEEQLCCPTFFTRTAYRWNGSDFRLQKSRLTYSVADPSAAPLVNYGEVVNNPKNAKR